MKRAMSNPSVGMVPRTEAWALRAGEEMQTACTTIVHGMITLSEWKYRDLRNEQWKYKTLEISTVILDIKVIFNASHFAGASLTLYDTYMRHETFSFRMSMSLILRFCFSSKG